MQNASHNQFALSIGYDLPRTRATKKKKGKRLERESTKRDGNERNERMDGWIELEFLKGISEKDDFTGSLFTNSKTGGGEGVLDINDS